MTFRSNLLLWATLLLSNAHLDADDAPPAAGHSMHGEAFDDGPRQKAYLMGGTGKVHLPVSTKNPEVQAFFDQGVGQLHGFWYYEAERSFRQAAALEPQCAMAYWGMALANVNNAKRAKGFIQKAVEKKTQADPRELKWIEAYADYWLGKKDEKERRRELIKSLENLNLEFPDELEAKAFLAFQIWDNHGKGWPIGSRLSVDALLRDIFAAEPMHPAHHYMIHLWDEEKPVRALASAARNGQSSPLIAHMWHMPGHTYSKLRRYEDAVWQQEASARTDHRYMIKDWVMPDQIHNYAHNNQWLVENLEFLGRTHDAVALAKNLIELPRHPRYNTFGAKGDAGAAKGKGSSIEGRKRLLETLLRYELWDELIALAGTVYLEPTEIPAEQTKRARALGIAYFGKSDSAKGKEQIESLQATLTKLRAQRFAAAEEAESKAKKEKKKDADIAKTMADAMQKFSERLNAIENALAELQALDARAAGDLPKCKSFFEAARDIPRDRSARLLLAVGDKEKAIKVAREDITDGEKQVYRLANLVDILRRAGKNKEALDEFAKLRALAASADLDSPLMQRLASFAEELKLAADWRIPKTPATDVGLRPNLDELGPLHWQPRAAPAWRFPAAAGGELSSAYFQGKPVIVIGYLGVGCVHCVGQLKTFGPMQKEFTDAGISLVAVSTESLSQIKDSLSSGKLGVDLLVPILADPGLTFFKAFRAYDDFEGMPLHGTFLIDGAGRVRWQDVSYEPFTDARFLLAEAKRLLALSSSGTSVH
jgi:peroxiredoxin